MAFVFTRSPYFIQKTSSDDNVTCKLYVDGTSNLRYTLSKPVINGKATFELSELVRDYIQPAYDNDEGRVRFRVDLIDSSGTDSSTHSAIDGYLTHDEGIQTDDNASSSAFVGITSHNSQRRMMVSDLMDTYAPYFVSNSVSYVQFDETDAGVGNVSGTSVYFDLVECSKYDNIALRFLNKSGAIQTMFFNKKHVEQIRAKSKTYNINTIDYDNLTYNEQQHANIKRVQNSSQMYTVNTDFLDEYYNQTIEEIILSEYVWAYIDGAWKPVNVDTNSLTKKTHVNDKLVQFELKLNVANNHININR